MENQGVTQFEEMIGSLINRIERKAEMKTFGPSVSKYNSNSFLFSATVNFWLNGNKHIPNFNITYSKSTNQTHLFVPNYRENFETHQGDHYFDGVPCVDDILRSFAETDYKIYSFHEM